MQKVKLNIVPKGVKKTTYLSQNDNGRVVRYELFNELVPYTLDGSETITVKVVRPDGEEIVSSVPNTEAAYIDVTFNDDMSAIAGVGAGEIKITDGETVLGSHNFDINVEIDAYNGKDVVIETETGTLLSFNTEVEDNALEYESEIPYNAAGYTGLRVVNTRTAPVYDKTPYLFRKTPSGYGNSCIEKLNGLSVAFNQLVRNGNFETTDGWGFLGDTTGSSITVSSNYATIAWYSRFSNNGLYRPFTYQVNHKYLLSCKVKNISGATRTFTLGQPYGERIDGVFNDNEEKFLSGIMETEIVSGQGYDVIALSDGQTNRNNSAIISNFICFDLTQMFGSTIADHIYSLETAQAGAGVAYFKLLFGADYYPYSAGELMSVKTSGRKTIGFNQWDEQWEVSGSGITSKNYIPVIPNTNYYFKIPIGWLTITEYDIYKNAITTYSIINNTRTLSANCVYIKFATSSAYGTTYLNDICINISDPERNGQYEPYNAVTYPLDPDLELRGIPKLDANNKLYGDGDIYESSGDVTRRYGIVDLGSLEWILKPQGFFNASLAGLKFITDTSGLPNLLCLPYITDTPAHVYGGTTDKTISTATGGANIWLRDAAYSDAATFKAAMSGVYLVYELATPTSESADPFTDPQEARVTEEFIDTRAIPIPVAQDSIYGTDIEYQDIDFDTTIFGGNINAVDGVLSSEYNSDGSVKTTPEIIDITPTPIPVKAGDNKIFNTANGNQTIRYYNQVEE